MISPSSNESPHSGQNLGGVAPFSGSHPHLSHLYCGIPAGFLAPQFWQNFPLFIVPQEQIHPLVSTGFGEPHSGQNFPVTVAPHLHFQAPACTGSGFFAPHSGQNFPVAVAPQVHFQLFCDGTGVGSGAGCWVGCIC